MKLSFSFLILLLLIAANVQAQSVDSLIIQGKNSLPRLWTDEEASRRSRQPS